MDRLVLTQFRRRFGSPSTPPPPPSAPTVAAAAAVVPSVGVREGREGVGKRRGKWGGWLREGRGGEREEGSGGARESGSCLLSMREVSCLDVAKLYIV